MSAVKSTRKSSASCPSASSICLEKYRVDALPTSCISSFVALSLITFSKIYEFALYKSTTGDTLESLVFKKPLITRVFLEPLTADKALSLILL